jgi:hypothetical protein
VRYLYDKEKQASMEAWELKLKIISGKGTARVIPIASTKGP